MRPDMKRQSSKVMPAPVLDGAPTGAPPAARTGPLAPLAPHGPLAPLAQRPVLVPLGAPPIAPMPPPQRQTPMPPLPAPSNPAPPSGGPPPPQLAAAPSQPPAPAGAKPSGPSAPPASPPPPLVTTAASSHDAREPASIADLASPVASSGSHVAAAAAAPPAAADAPKPPPPAASAQSPQPPAPAAAHTAANPLAATQPPHERRTPQPQAPPPPPPYQPQPPQPPLPGALPSTPTASPVAAPAGKGPAGGATGGAKGVPVPPPSPPPPALLRNASVADLADEMRPVEEYIPFGFVELRGKLIEDHPQIFSDAAVLKKFEELCKWISLRNTLRLALDYGDAHDKYAPLDPDKDTLAMKGAGGNARESAPPSKVVPSGTIKKRVAGFNKELTDILDKAEFEELPPEDLEKAKNDKSLMGLDVQTASDEYLEFRVNYRGTRLKKVQWRRWGLFKRQIEMNVYERLAISFRLKKPVCKDDMPEDPGAFGMNNKPWYKRLFCDRQVAVSASLSELRDEFVYMKLFKDVLQCDVDMLLPGAVIKFTWFDYLMIWVPIIGGCGFAVWKAIKGTLNFKNIKDAALSVALIGMPLTWGIRAYMAIKEKQRLHQARLNALMLLHNLNNNAGVISQLLEEAQEQEDNEAMLAYLFLWRGAASPQPMRKLDLDRAVEAYLQKKLDESGCAVRMDFEVTDSILKLERMGLLQTVLSDKGEKLLQVIPLDQALEKSHVRHFDETKETGHFLQQRSKTKRNGAIGMAWHECLDIFRPTGQAFRYWWNAETGESTYYEPDEPYVKLSPEAALELSQAHGIALQGPGKYSNGHAKAN